MEKGGGEGHTV